MNSQLVERYSLSLLSFECVLNRLVEIGMEREGRAGQMDGCIRNALRVVMEQMREIY